MQLNYRRCCHHSVVAIQAIKLYAVSLWNVQDNRIRRNSVYCYVPLMCLAALFIFPRAASHINGT